MAGNRWAALALIGCLVPTWALAEREPKEGPQDPRIRTVVYNPRDVVRVEATYGYHTVVEFADEEQIESLVIGDSVAWDAERGGSGNRVYLKPKEDNAATNLTVITNRRTYSFSLLASKSVSPTSMTWRLRFEYPEEEAAQRIALEQRQEVQRAAYVTPPGATVDPSRWNFDYAYSAKRKGAVVPVQMFDDGEFTYFKFKDTQDLPAIFVVDEDKKEALVNSRVSGEYIVVNRVAGQFALRNGEQLTCIFNEAYDKGNGTPVNAPRIRDDRRAARSSKKGADDAVGAR